MAIETQRRLNMIVPLGEVTARRPARGNRARASSIHESARLPPYDTIGLEQLDIRDHEAAFAPGTYDPDDVASFLRNATHYVRENGPVLCDGDTMDGPGERRWQIHSFDNSLAMAPREVMRWLPMDGVDGRVDTSIVPAVLLDG